MICFRPHGIELERISVFKLFDEYFYIIFYINYSFFDEYLFQLEEIL